MFENTEKILLIFFIYIYLYIFLSSSVGHRIWIDFVDYNLDDSQSVKLFLSNTADYVTPFKYSNSINDGSFLSEGESVKIEYSTNSQPRGRGFKIAYKTGIPTNDNNL